MFKSKVGIFQSLRRVTRGATIWAAASAGLLIIVGATTLLAQDAPPDNMQCIDAQSKCQGPPTGLPGGVIYTCNLDTTPMEYGDACFFKLVSQPKENYVCGGTYPGKNCTDTTGVVPCYTYEQGTCNLVDVAGQTVLQCDDNPQLPKFMATRASNSFLETCVNH